MGDVIQTSPLIHGLRLKYPDAHIALMVRTLGETVAQRNPDVNEVLAYHEDALFKDLVSNDSRRLLRAYCAAEEYIQKLRACKFDVAYNCTNSIASAVLLKAAGIPEVVGAHFSDDGEYLIRGKWTNYFYTSLYNRDYSDFNLCDVFRNFLEEPPCSGKLVFEVRQSDRDALHELLRQRNVCDGRPLICFQLGASDKEKRWPVERFAQLAKCLKHLFDAQILLVGVKAEEELGRQFDELLPGVAVPLYGETSLPQLGALLDESAVLVSNDTGTMHIAAAVGCPVVLVSIGYVHFRETGPYGEGHIAVEAHGQNSRESAAFPKSTPIQASHVLFAVRAILEKDEPPSPAKDEFAAVDLYRSALAPDGHLAWRPLLPRPLQESDVLRSAYRAMWLDFLSDGKETAHEQESLRAFLSCHDTGGFPATATIEVETAPFTELARIAQEGISKTRELLTILGENRSMREAQPLVAALRNLDERIRLFGELHPSTRPLSASAAFQRDALEGSDPVQLARTTLQIYDGLARKSALMGTKLRLISSTWQELGGASASHG
ncbi:MAG: glycosyltransferase family 9 protein [Candidatus Hydrogenedentes bacterium]|nr:glycosyltransferase family 9 protein [Candidatus Hydrogenedentota bacterium]